MVPAGLFGHPRTCTLPRKNPETKNVWFQPFLIWHPHHVPAFDDAVGTNPPVCRAEKCNTRLVLSIAQCRTHEANLDLKIAEKIAKMTACDVRSARKVLGRGFARKAFPTLHGPPQYPDRPRVHECR